MKHLQLNRNVDPAVRCFSCEKTFPCVWIKFVTGSRHSSCISVGIIYCNVCCVGSLNQLLGLSSSELDVLNKRAGRSGF